MSVAESIGRSKPVRRMIPDEHTYRHPLGVVDVIADEFIAELQWSEAGVVQAFRNACATYSVQDGDALFEDTWHRTWLRFAQERLDDSAQ